MDARFRSNLEMIGRNEPITKKAKFWQSYVRALKGTDDMRAPEHTHRPRGIYRSEFPDLHSWNPFGKSIYDDPIHAADRINTPGYRYMPVHRDIYGYTPRQIYPHQYKPVDRFIPARPYDPKRAWDDHLGRLGDLDVLSNAKPFSRGPILTSPLMSRKSFPLTSKPLFDIRGSILEPYSVVPLYPMSVIRGAKTLQDMFEPSVSAPISSFTRDPFWYPSLAPYIPSYAQRSSPFFLRDSYLSPVKRNYLWSRHPLRPFVLDPTMGYQYYSQPVPVYHFTTPWYNKH